MEIVDDSLFINKLCENKSLDECGIQSLEDINLQIKGLMPQFTKRGSEIDEFTILSVDSITNYEGIVKIVSLKIIPPGKKHLSRARSHVVICDILPRVIVPIILKVADEVYILLVSQKRVTLGGRHTIEVFRGSVTADCAPENYGKSLIERKINDIDNLFDLIEIRNLGTYWNNTGNSGTSSPIQALFYVAKTNVDLAKIKQDLKINYKYDPDPSSGPPLPITAPIIRKLEEVMARVKESVSSSSESEAYINDLFSITALTALNQSLVDKPLPY